MKQFTFVALSLFIFFYPLTANTQTIDDVSAAVLNGVWWTSNDILANQSQLPVDQQAPSPHQIKMLYPNIKGVFATVKWKDIEPDFDPVNDKLKWDALDPLLNSYSQEGLYIILMIWTGPDCPS